jgi:hypothetical protein
LIWEWSFLPLLCLPSYTIKEYVSFRFVGNENKKDDKSSGKFENGWNSNNGHIQQSRNMNGALVHFPVQSAAADHSK